MVRRRQSRRLFEETGLLKEPETNPYKLVGLDSELVAGILNEDRSGEALKGIVGNFVTKVLMRRYHPDNQETGNSVRFREIREAHERIKQAEIETLRRWTKTDESVKSGELQKIAAVRSRVTEQVGAMVAKHMETNSHPQHTSQLQWAQGLLLRRGKSTLLLRQQDQGVEVLRGKTMQTGVGSSPTGEAKTGPFDVRSFLWQNKLFGLEPLTPIAAYIDETGRASLLRQDLSFIMDVTEALGERRLKREMFSRDMVKAIGGRDAWMRQSDPVIIATTVPKYSSQKLPADVMVFPQNDGRRLAWKLPLEVAGSVTEKRFFDRFKHARDTGSLAVSSGLRTTGATHFNLAPVTPVSLVEEEVGYSGVLAHGSSLLLYDRALAMPFATNCEIMGMVGSYPQAAE